MPYSFLTPTNGYIFRLTHRDNLAWSLANGLHAVASQIHDPAFRAIGKQNLIDRRRSAGIPIAPGGTLSDYVPFYFTPSTPMLLNIVTGQGVHKHRPQDLVIIVASLHDLHRAGVSFVFTDRHALLHWTRFFTSVRDLTSVDWSALQSRDFRRDAEDPDRIARYQAEALVHRHMPASLIRGVACYDEASKAFLDDVVSRSPVSPPVKVFREWFLI
jgi:hypothetical protein